MNPYFKTPSVVKNLIIINVLVYMATSMLPIGGFIHDHFSLMVNSPALEGWRDVFGNITVTRAGEFHLYQFFTYMFLHGDFNHIFVNMFGLWMFGRSLEYELGSQRFLIYYTVCGLGAALIQVGVAFLFGESMSLVGASGAVMGLLLAFGVMHPNAVIMLLFPPIPMKAKWFVVIYAAIELFMGWRGVGNVAHFAHIGGMLWGLLLLLWWRKKGKIFF